MTAMTKGTAMKDKKKTSRRWGRFSAGSKRSQSSNNHRHRNFLNAVKFGFWDFNTNTYAYSIGIKDGSTSVLTTGSAVNTGQQSPTPRTIQTQNVAVADYIAAYNNNFIDIPIVVAERKNHFDMFSLTLTRKDGGRRRYASIFDKWFCKNPTS